MAKSQNLLGGSTGKTELSHVLDAFGLGKPVAVRPAGGTASPKWAVATEKGRFVVRLRPSEFSSVESIRFDHQAMRRLREAGLPVPVPLPGPDGSTYLCHQGQVYEVLDWVEGDPFPEGNLDAVYALGVFLARFHGALGEDIPPGKRDPQREDHPDLLEPYLTDLRRLALRDEDRRLLDQVAVQLGLVRQRLDGGLYTSLPRCVIHGDIHPGNLRFGGSQVAAVYDFDYLSVQARARDLGDGLIFFAARRDTPVDTADIRSLTQPFSLDLERCRVLVRGYQSMTLLTDLEWQALPLLIRSRWVQMRLRGCRKVAADEKVGFVLHRFFEVIDWLDDRATVFFAELRAGL